MAYIPVGSAFGSVASQGVTPGPALAGAVAVSDVRGGGVAAVAPVFTAAAYPVLGAPVTPMISTQSGTGGGTVGYAH